MEFDSLISNTPVTSENLTSYQTLLDEVKEVDASLKDKKEKRQDVNAILNHALLQSGYNREVEEEGVYHEICFYSFKINEEKQQAYKAMEQRLELFINFPVDKSTALDVFCEYILFALSERRYIQETYLKYFIDLCMSYGEQDIYRILNGFNLLSIGYTIQEDQWTILKEMTFKNSKWKLLVEYLGVINANTRNNFMKSIKESALLVAKLEEESHSKLITNLYLLEIVNYMSLKEDFLVFKLIKDLENKLTANNEYTRALRREIEQLKSHAKNPSYSPSFAKMLGESFYPKTIINRKFSV